MRQVKKFHELSRRQRNRRLKQLQFSENFVPQNVNGLNNKATNSLLNEVISDEDSKFVLNNNISNNYFENTNTNAVTDRSNITHISIFPTFSEREHFLFDKKQISLREKLILWTDKYKVHQKAVSSLLKILRSEGNDDIPNDARTLMNTPRSTILYKRSGGSYYHYGLQNGIIDQLKQLNLLSLSNIIYINVNIDGLPIAFLLKVRKVNCGLF